MDKNKEIFKKENLKYIGLGSLVILALILGILKMGSELPNKKNTGRTEKVNVLHMTDSIENLEGSQFGIYKNYLYKWQNGKLYLRSLTEEGVSYNMALNIGNPLVIPGNKYIFVANPEEGIIYFLNSKAEMLERIPLNTPIFSMKEDGDNLIYHTKLGANESVGIIDSNLNNLMKYNYDGESVLTYDFDPSKSKVAIGVLNVEEKSIGTRLDLYRDLSNKESLYFDGEIILDLDYIGLGNLLVLTDNNLYYISENNIVWKKDFTLIKDMEVEGSNIYVLNGTHLTVLDTKGQVKEDLAFTEQYSKIYICETGFLKDELILYNSGELVVLKKGEEFLRHKQEILQVDKAQGKIFILDQAKYGFYENSVEEVEIEEE